MNQKSKNSDIIKELEHENRLMKDQMNEYKIKLKDSENQISEHKKNLQHQNEQKNNQLKQFQQQN